MRPAPMLVAAVAAVALVAAGCGGDDDTTTAGSGGGERTVEVEMVDLAFEPDTLDVERGETIRFVFTNRGKIAHDAFVGDREAQADHEAEMRDGNDHGGHGDDDDDAVTVEPGATEELTYTFGERGRVEIGCHQPGHYDAGMKVIVEVA